MKTIDLIQTVDFSETPASVVTQVQEVEFEEKKEKPRRRKPRK